jgi:hypothetical protein
MPDEILTPDEITLLVCVLNQVIKNISPADDSDKINIGCTLTITTDQYKQLKQSIKKLEK